MRPRRSVLDERPATATTPAHPELGVELLVRARPLLDEAGQRLITQPRADELLDQRRVREACAALDRVTFQPLVQQHGQRDVRPHRRLLLDLLAKAVA
jgi:hypothetical protein